MPKTLKYSEKPTLIEAYSEYHRNSMVVFFKNSSDVDKLVEATKKLSFRVQQMLTVWNKLHIK